MKKNSIYKKEKKLKYDKIRNKNRKNRKTIKKGAKIEINIKLIKTTIKTQKSRRGKNQTSNKEND
jgi:hypothetical protein